MGSIYDATWGRAFSALYDRVTKGMEDAGLREMRRETLAGASGRTIDIGSGTGANVGLYPEAVTELVFAEPDPQMTKRLRPKVREAGLEAEVVEAPAEDSLSRTRASIPPSTPWSSARSPTRPRRWPRRRGS